ncbi:MULTISPECIES: CobW family GTP-binding protein [Priestia]|jgi:G3E family GTPase|uniref:CobW family GTP-binding protein n=1 Tax=Priestia TaxID=2800373 RepID=UPI000BECEEC4|nr:MULTISPECIES: GTP-binding protein [Priestia]MDR7247070.1 G3E family GTPase [Priestia megaterium]MED3855044.1 GTP-binding protein [Priestia megaterium]PEB60688.1 cobalamin biosynthesis protein [Priestia megaterium]PFK69883.1 cobalamin biosynthesis protein [Priestia megaterium]QTL52409.1 GTP-binding protein [Priestia aryabhattai]
MKKINISILGGFLGSGKTTLLQNILKEEKKRNRKVAVLLNEIGEHSVDTDIIGTKIPLKELLNGCICCTLKNELEIQLLSLYQQHQPDVIYIETTGVAHPLEVLDACLSPIIAPFIDIKSIISVVDLKRWMDRYELNQSLQKLLVEQIRYSDYLLLNKSDLVTDKEQSSIQKEIIKINPKAKINLTTYAQVSLEEINHSNRSCGATHEELHVHHHLHIQTMTYQFEGSVIKKEFDEWIKNLPNNIYRIKGFLQFEDDQVHTHLFQYSYRSPYSFPQKKTFPKNLVFIGKDFDLDRLKKELKDLEQNAKQKVSAYLE